ncbi:hypothetical protein [Synechococcus phage S-H9-2]|jgi:hypothetical protein|uniref:Uncharacterized protein n=1 Tax=Synechococcus phage S-H9-2 TaxID=2783669 RepID=A0A873WFW7_9CAUD|nr:hypothetical protein PQC10_gp009 [Synechococcus phage S-H9-2]QPB08286.1 hypothetical protein [Synechococcus phage S-H9-2]
MANSPVDKSEEFKESGMTLITEVDSEYWLKKHRKNKYSTPPEDRMSRPCGGQNGFDDFVERWSD